MELALGEVTSDFGLPEWLSKPRASTQETEERLGAEKIAKSPAVFKTVKEAVDELMGQQQAVPTAPTGILPSEVTTIPLVELPKILAKAKETAKLAALQSQLGIINEAIRLRKLEDKK